MADTRDISGPVSNWTAPPRPDMAPLEGRFVRLERLDADRHAADLFAANGTAEDLWRYMAYGPFSSAAQYHRWVRDWQTRDDTLFYAIQSKATGHFIGVASFLRIAPQDGSIEVGHICFSPHLRRSPAATEAIYLMMEWAFCAGYRRFEWKCNAANRASRAAAQRFGFSYEGVFRQATISKGRNRDTAWFAIIDAEWPALRSAFGAWLAPTNFTADGTQIERLGDLTRLVRAADDPSL